MADNDILPNLGSYYEGIGQILGNHLVSEQHPSNGEFGMDLFINDFEDEFPRDGSAEAEDRSDYPVYSVDAQRAAKGQPYGYKRTARPRVQELNQPPQARTLGWRVLDLYPSRERKDEFFRLAGTPFELRLLLELTRHIYEISSKAPGGWGFQHTFEEWFAVWEKGFSGDINRPNAQGLQSNYPPRERRDSQGNVVSAWRQDINRRPSYAEWSNPNPDTKKHYRNIEYWPDRDNPRESYVVSGSDAYLIESIQQIEWMRILCGGGVEAGNRQAVSEAKFLTGFPEINLVFREKYPPLGKSKIESHFTISMVGFIESEHLRKWPNDEVVTPTLMRRWADRIKQSFFPNDDEERAYHFARGKEIYSYCDWRLGYDSWSPFRSENDARAFYERLIFIKGDGFIPDLVVPGKRKPYKEKEVVIFGEQKKFTSGYRDADLYFWRAYLTLPRLKERYNLVSRSVKSPVNIPED